MTSVLLAKSELIKGPPAHSICYSIQTVYMYMFSSNCWPFKGFSPKRGSIKVDDDHINLVSLFATPLN